MTTHLCIHGDVFTQTQTIVDWIASRTGWPVVSDDDLLEAASQRLAIPAKRLAHRLRHPGGVLNRLTHGTERAMASVQSVMVDKLGEKTTIFHSALGLPTTRQLPHVLNVLVTASARFRVKRARRIQALSERQARSLINHEDHREFAWCRYAFGDARFDADAYDLVIPSDRLEVESAGRLILDQLMRTEMHATANPAFRLADLKLASEVWLRLSKGGYPVSAAARNGRVRLTVDRPVLFLNRLANKLNRQVMQVKGVQDVQIDVGPDFFQTDIYRRCRFELPVETKYSSYAQCRQHLHDNAAACFPTVAKQEIRQEQIKAVQQLSSNASP
jgi:cytidylate kinase